MAQFQPPGDATRRDAIGPLAGLSEGMRRLLDPAAFEPIPVPGPADWLANHHEPGQTFQQFVDSHPNRPTATARTIYLQPLDKFSTDGPSLPKLKAFTEAFFAMPVTTLPVMQPAGRIQTRVNPYSNSRQLLTRDILHVLRRMLPKDAYCLLGITLQDLYPDPSWNFVFGEASLRDRVGVYSFARYDPQFYGDKTADRSHVMLRRSCKVLAHETSHMFGIAHCIYFHCLMNGSNHLAESDARPMHLCPVDLHKLYDSVRFDPVARYAHLRDFCRSNGFTDEAAWIESQLARVGHEP